MLSPELAKLALAYITEGKIDESYRQVFAGARSDVGAGVSPPEPGVGMEGEAAYAISH